MFTQNSNELFDFIYSIHVNDNQAYANQCKKKKNIVFVTRKNRIKFWYSFHYFCYRIHLVCGIYSHISLQWLRRKGCMAAATNVNFIKF